VFALTEKDSELSLPLSGRDPLGTQAVWQHRARDIVPDLVAASQHAEGFHILLIAHAWWPQMAEAMDVSRLTFKQFFLLIEQAFARASRFENRDWVLPGSRRLGSGDKKLWFGLGKSAHLLDNQLTNGVYGLYRGPALRAGLIDADDRICDAQFWRKIIDETSVIKKLFKPMEALSAQAGDARRSDPIRKPVARELTEILQRLPFKRQLREAFVTPSKAPITTSLAGLLIRRAALERNLSAFLSEAIDAMPAHADVLRNVIRCEQYIAPLDAIFQAICSADERNADRAADTLDIDLAELRAARTRFESSGNYRELALERAKALLALDLDSKRGLVRSLIEHHGKISMSRSNAPWIAFDEAGKLDSSLVGPQPAQRDLSPATAWLNSYYLYAFESLTRKVASERTIRT
jgi:hypothetical protein